MAKTLKITTDNRIRVVDVDFDRLEDIRREIGGSVERVCTQKLQDYFGSGAMMIVDEEGLLKGLPMNPVGSFFYGTAQHGNPIGPGVLDSSGRETGGRMGGQNEKGFLAEGMRRRTYYPESRVKITSPFYLLSCTCGLRIWSVLGEMTPCPNCGKMMKLEERGNGST